MKLSIRPARVTRSSLLLSGALAVWAAGSSSAGAQVATSDPAPPAQCTAKPKHAEKFKAGLANGKQKAEALFAAADVGRDPQKLRKKLSRVLDRLHVHVREAIASDTADGRRCRVQGVVDGFILRIAQLLGQCVFDGAQWGQFVANLYCELSVELGGLAGQGEFYRAPAGVCGTLFETVCDNSYAYVATEGATPLISPVKQFLSARGLTLQPYPGCRPYTQAPFNTVFAEAIHFDCSYGPP